MLTSLLLFLALIIIILGFCGFIPIANGHDHGKRSTVGLILIGLMVLCAIGMFIVLNTAGKDAVSAIDSGIQLLIFAAILTTVILSFVGTMLYCLTRPLPPRSKVVVPPFTFPKY